MNEGTNSDAELQIVEDEVELEERRKLGGYNLIEGITVVMLTEVMPDKSTTLEKEVLESEEPNQSPGILSPMGSFPSLE